MRILLIIVILLLGAIVFYAGLNIFRGQTSPTNTEFAIQQDNQGGPEILQPHPLSIEALRNGDYPGSELIIEQILTAGSNYQRYIVSYKSEGLKIFGLLSIPNGTPPDGGWPAIIFNHGYISPSVYRTTEKYIAYTDGFSRNGYVLFKSDFRGHGNSEGQATGGYGSNAYTIDVLNAISSIKKLKDPLNVNSQKLIVDPSRIGMWGHSMGGFITLRIMVVDKDVKAGVIWGGVVASYPDLLERFRRRNPSITPLPGNTRGSWRQSLIDQYGDAQSNPDFWNSISANYFLSEISGPIQLHHGTADTSVPIEFSEKLYDQLKTVGKEAEFYTYPGDDHNISGNFGIAMQRSIEFFDKYLK